MQSPPDEIPATAPDGLTDAVIAWFSDNARDLPWRRPDCSPWGVMVSEFMLQQTPVSRVLGPWQSWLERWPTPSALADDTAGNAVRAWGRLGYPRRALRLHASATVIEERHDGSVPDNHEALLALPGVGAYTAAAIASFAFGQEHVVLDTNVRRVLARAVRGVSQADPSPTAAERRLAYQAMPRSPHPGPPAPTRQSPTPAAVWAAGSMELGALICTSRAPKCADCPVRDRCRWVALGSPPPDGPPRRGQAYAGTDRQVRGLLLGVLRDSGDTVTRTRLDLVWPDPVQRARALNSLLDDGLIVPHGEDHYALPS